eukprot:CAMPEP_0119030120 /NCGR_PEP_ID=MMETSP1176-20130426/40872_1 /TAXON_ID=265551 /ORGANISM="Synedropsis recta cf, Strain CCMP1620" /LENGTH=92 /DNA_ID=CAMNT_0006986485 /DNA_START=1074 /DNA_END=1349 /DNA_ORIENTATION=+
MTPLPSSPVDISPGNDILHELVTKLPESFRLTSIFDTTRQENLPLLAYYHSGKKKVVVTRQNRKNREVIFSALFIKQPFATTVLLQDDIAYW